ncbi:MAG: nucleotidyltransferase domain-containing protein, partial [Candidatus Bathyarchaeota archaeon]|nr:nucleotidyltransferase domain-containing protein [Candidatus Bathyarchaeota archaeon]
HWEILDHLRKRSFEVMKNLEGSHLRSTVHGSIARGDVTQTSDIDIFISEPMSSFAVETALEGSGFQFLERKLIQATPLYALKGYIELDGQTSVSFPLVKMRQVEKEFYRFGGEATVSSLEKNKRVLGVDKRLMLIEPTDEGHIESTIVNKEKETAKLLGISPTTVLDRVRALLRRDKVGRTGVYIEKELNPEETFEQAMKKLADNNPAVRRRIRFFQK